MSRRLASAKQDFEEQVTTVVTDQLLPFEKREEIPLVGEPVPAASRTEGQQSDQTGGTGKQVVENNPLPKMIFSAPGLCAGRNKYWKPLGSRSLGDWKCRRFNHNGYLSHMIRHVRMKVIVFMRFARFNMMKMI